MILSQSSVAAGPPSFSDAVFDPRQPTLPLIYDTTPIGLAFLSPDCRYLQINQRLTDICGISVWPLRKTDAPNFISRLSGFFGVTRPISLGLNVAV